MRARVGKWNLKTLYMVLSACIGISCIFVLQSIVVVDHVQDAGYVHCIQEHSAASMVAEIKFHGRMGVTIWIQYGVAQSYIF